MTIPWWHPVLGDEEAQAVVEVIASGFPNDGELTERFAARIADISGVAHGVGVSSGSAAIYCALVACGVGPGAEVIVPDLTFVATANAVLLAGAEPVLADVRRDDFTLDPVAVADLVTSRTRAIVPVHVNGRGGSIAEIVALADRWGLTVVEDAAEALGSRYAGRPLGSFGHAAAFSFAPTKIVTTGQGGVVVTDDPSIARRVRELKDQGRATRGTGGADHHPVAGFNFKLTNVQAAIGLVQLDRLDQRLAHLRTLEDWYAEELRGAEHDVALVRRRSYGRGAPRVGGRPCPGPRRTRRASPASRSRSARILAPAAHPSTVRCARGVVPQRNARLGPGPLVTVGAVADTRARSVRRCVRS